MKSRYSVLFSLSRIFYFFFQTSILVIVFESSFCRFQGCRLSPRWQDLLWRDSLVHRIHPIDDVINKKRENCTLWHSMLEIFPVAEDVDIDSGLSSTKVLSHPGILIGWCVSLRRRPSLQTLAKSKRTRRSFAFWVFALGVECLQQLVGSWFGPPLIC